MRAAWLCFFRRSTCTGATCSSLYCSPFFCDRHEASEPLCSNVGRHGSKLGMVSEVSGAKFGTCFETLETRVL